MEMISRRWLFTSLTAGVLIAVAARTTLFSVECAVYGLEVIQRSALQQAGPRNVVVRCCFAQQGIEPQERALPPANGTASNATTARHASTLRISGMVNERGGEPNSPPLS